MTSPGKPRRRPIGRRLDAMQDRIDHAAIRLEAAKVR
jgi:hypothetical protein